MNFADRCSYLEKSHTKLGRRMPRRIRHWLPSCIDGSLLEVLKARK